jgi:hypothetical protein
MSLASFVASSLGPGVRTNAGAFSVGLIKRLAAKETTPPSNPPSKPAISIGLVSRNVPPSGVIRDCVSGMAEWPLLGNLGNEFPNNCHCLSINKHFASGKQIQCLAKLLSYGAFFGPFWLSLGFLTIRKFNENLNLSALFSELASFCRITVFPRPKKAKKYN